MEQQAQEELDCANHLPVTGRKHHHCGSTGLRRYVVGCPQSQHGARSLGSFLVDDQVPRPALLLLTAALPSGGQKLNTQTPTLWGKNKSH